MITIDDTNYDNRMQLLKNKTKVFWDCIKIFDYKLFGVYNLGSKNSLSKLDFALKFSKKINKKLNYFSLSANNNKIFKRNLNIGMNVQKIEKKLGLKIINSNQVINNLIKNASSRN
jgi:dTDP-4-dehydrorhamnose reductase